MNKDSDKIIMTVAEFLADAQTSDLVSEQGADEEQDAKMKDSRARRDEEWSLLANQVVGGETGIFPSHKVASGGEQSEAPKAAGVDASPSHCCGGH